MNVTSAARRQKRLFGKYLAQAGALATWKRRTTNVPDSGGAISGAHWQGDPVDVGWVAPLDDPDMYVSGGRIRVAFDVPTNRQDVSAAQMLTGTTTGYVSTENEVMVGDVLIVGSVPWYVDGARPAAEGGGFPCVYRELTLRRQGAA